jgi:hypothetical protein
LKSGWPSLCVSQAGSTLRGVKIAVISAVIREKKSSDSRWSEGCTAVISEFSLLPTNPTHLSDDVCLYPEKMNAEQ